MPQVFGCPNCHIPFQVPDDAAGQEFQCPSCESVVQIPAEVHQPAPDPKILTCPHCDGQFGIDASMYGEELACPHCEQLVAIGEVQQQMVPPVINEEVEFVEEIEASEEPQFEAVEEVEPRKKNENDKALAAGKMSGKAAATGESQITAPNSEPATDQKVQTENDADAPEAEQLIEAPLPDPVFEPQPVAHLLPPRFDVPDPVRFPSRLGDEVILPDGAGGYQAVDANIVTITHNGEVYQLKRLTPEQRQRRRLIHNTVAICVAVALIYLTLRTLGLVS